MISGIGSVGGLSSSYSVSASEQLTLQTKAKLESMGIDTTNITTELQGQAALQSSQAIQQSDETKGFQQAGGNHAATMAIKAEAIALAQKLGASVSSTDKLAEIMEAISNALSTMQAQAANDPEKAAQVAQYQAEFDSICQSISNIQESMQASQSQPIQIQASMTGLAAYNLASMSISHSNKNSK